MLMIEELKKHINESLFEEKTGMLDINGNMTFFNTDDCRLEFEKVGDVVTIFQEYFESGTGFIKHKHISSANDESIIEAYKYAYDMLLQSALNNWCELNSVTQDDVPSFLSHK